MFHRSYWAFYLDTAQRCVYHLTNLCTIFLLLKGSVGTHARTHSHMPVNTAPALLLIQIGQPKTQLFLSVFRTNSSLPLASSPHHCRAHCREEGGGECGGLVPDAWVEVKMVCGIIFTVLFCICSWKQQAIRLGYPGCTFAQLQATLHTVVTADFYSNHNNFLAFDSKESWGISVFC